MIKIIIVLCLIKLIICEKQLKQCNTTSFPSVCPMNTICSQQPINVTNAMKIATVDVEDGLCQCITNDNFIFNSKYANDNDYCIITNKTSIINMGPALIGPVNNVIDSNSSASRQPPPDTHHIVGGILIPILLVFIFVGVVIAVKRLNVIQRLRNIQVSRRNRPLYEDVMMGNDTDDPPLI